MAKRSNASRATWLFELARWLDDGNGDIEVAPIVPAVGERPSVHDKGTASVAFDGLRSDSQATPIVPNELPVARGQSEQPASPEHPNHRPGAARRAA